MKLFTEEARWLINSIEYRKTPINAETESLMLSITPKDSIRISKRTKTEVQINVCRQIDTKPIKTYELSIETVITIKFINEKAANGLSDDEIIDRFKEQCENMLSNLMAKISLLISEITGSEGIPIVTPLCFIKTINYRKKLVLLMERAIDVAAYIIRKYKEVSGEKCFDITMPIYHLQFNMLVLK